jgi:hypothetical protein
MPKGLEVFQNEVLRRIFVPNIEEVMSHSQHHRYGEWRIVNNKMGRKWKKTGVVHCKALFQYQTGGIDENYKISLSIYRMSGRESNSVLPDHEIVRYQQQHRDGRHWYYQCCIMQLVWYGEYVSISFDWSLSIAQRSLQQMQNTVLEYDIKDTRQLGMYPQLCT